MSKKRTRNRSQETAPTPAPQSQTIFPDPPPEDLSKPQGVESLRAQEAFSSEYHAAKATGKATREEWDAMSEEERQELVELGIAPEDDSAEEPKEASFDEAASLAKALSQSHTEEPEEDIELTKADEPDESSDLLVSDPRYVDEGFTEDTPLARLAQAGEATVREFAQLADLDTRAAKMLLDSLRHDGLVAPVYRQGSNRYSVTSAGEQVIRGY